MKHHELTQKCTSCGQKKPLSAFIQLGKNREKTYSKICASCRGTTLEDGSTTQGFSIDNKTQILDALEQKEHLEKVDLEKKQEQEKRDRLETEKKQKTETATILERNRRDSYYKQFFSTPRQETAPQKSTLADIQKPDTDPTTLATEEKTRTEEQARQDTATREKGATDTQQLTTVDLKELVTDKLTHTKFQSANFQNFRTWLGSNAPLMKVLGQLNQPNQPQTKAEAQKPQAEKPAPTETKTNTPPPAQKSEQKESKASLLNANLRIAALGYLNQQQAKIAAQNLLSEKKAADSREIGAPPANKSETKESTLLEQLQDWESTSFRSKR